MKIDLMRVSVIVGLAVTLTACGGGTNGGTGTPTPAATVSIGTEPTNQTIVEGQVASFQVVATGSAGLSYQWQLNGADIGGATASSYTTPPESAAADGAQIQVRVTSGSATSVSGPATLHVYAETAIPAPIQTVIDPASTDSNIDDSYGMHYAYFNAAVTPKNQLFLFLPGSTAKPQDYLLIVQAAADNGYHALGLAYQDSSLVTGPCMATGDPNCPGDVHQATLSGAATSSIVSVTVADSLENRLLKALKYLSQLYPQQGWSTYLDASGNILWSRIRVSGHSQGGSLSAYIGKQFAVARVSMFSSPDDQVSNNVAAWIAAAGQTDPSRYYGFAHMQDALIPFGVIQQNWPALQLAQFGNYVNVDNDPTPYSGSHTLYSDLTASGLVTPLTYHNITVVDVTTPMDSDGLPTYRHVWQYLCFL